MASRSPPPPQVAAPGAKSIGKHFIYNHWMDVYDRKPHQKSLNQPQMPFEIKESALAHNWANMPGAGVFATRKIKAGEVVLLEDPGSVKLICFEKGVNYKSDHPEMKDVYDALHNASPLVPFEDFVVSQNLLSTVSSMGQARRLKLGAWAEKDGK